MTPTLRRLPQLVIGLLTFGVGLGLVVQGANGQGPWTVFHEGFADHTPLSIGTATIATGILLGLTGSWVAAARHMRRIEPR